MAFFESLSDKLQGIAARMKGKARVGEQDIKDMMREIRLALLEADVNFQVVKQFVDEVSLKCRGSDVLESLTPGQQVVKIVHEALVDMLGTTQGKLAVSPSGFTVILLCGLQGSGKTTTAAKLGLYLKKKGKKPMLASCDVHRPAAALQLEVLANQAGLPSFIQPEEKDAVSIAKRAVERAKYLFNDTLIVDTAGRMTVDPAMMDELRRIRKAVDPTETLLVVDAMTGQEAVAIAQSFHQEIGVDGFVMTKLDGDARGGAALSIRKMTGLPIKFACVGEKIADIEEYSPERMASRILGMGDVLGLIELATVAVDEKKARESLENLRRNRFTLVDMLSQMEEVLKMGSVGNVLDMIPGIDKKKFNASDVDDRMVVRSVAIMRSMTVRERLNPSILNASRRKRIAAGSGTQVQDVNRVVRQFEETEKMMKQFSSMSKGKNRRAGFPGMPF
jgi:signal recognition particle subunit SRP54